MADPATLVFVTAVFLLAGVVKGVIGIGLPIVSVGLLITVLELPAAMALTLIPAFATNAWQAVTGGQGIAILRRTWPFMLAAVSTVWLGAAALTRIDLPFLSLIFGAVLIAYGTSGLAGLRVAIPAHRETLSGVVFGLANGVISGMTGAFSMPGVMFLQGIGLNRDGFIQSMGILFGASSAALALALHEAELLNAELGLTSALALVPAMAGVVAGQRIRARLSEARFRQVFLVGLCLLGVYVAGVSALEVGVGGPSG